MPSPPKPEFSRTLVVERLRTEEGGALRSEAEAGELAALTRRFDAGPVTAFAVEAEATPWGPGGWRLSGRVSARLAQTCVVTLEPVETAIDEPFLRFYAPARRMEEAEARLDADLRDDLEPLGETIDAGEAAAETAALAIDPYPRRADAAFAGAAHGPPGVAPLTDEAARPFAKLAALRAAADRGD